MATKYKFQLERYPSNQEPKPIMTPRKDIDWEGKAVFNPSVVYDQGVFKMLYRTYPSNLDFKEPRFKRPGHYFTNQVSSIGYAESKDGINFERREQPFIAPDTDYDRFGCEDPRVTKIGDTFYITYTAIDESLQDRGRKANVRIALATTKDFVTVQKHGIIGPPERSKAAAFYPETVKDGKIGFLMTVASDSANSRVLTRYYDSIDDISHSTPEDWSTFFATENATLKTEWWLHRGPELGAAPIKTERGWLLIFSAESMSDTWTIGAALLDKENPNKLIARTPGYILRQ